MEGEMSLPPEWGASGFSAPKGWNEKNITDVDIVDWIEEHFDDIISGIYLFSYGRGSDAVFSDNLRELAVLAMKNEKK